MNRIDVINLSRLHNNEHFQFMTDVQGLIGSHGAATLGIEAHYPPFEQALAEEGVALRVEQGNILSKQIAELDKLRDRTWSASSARVKATLLSPNPEDITSAEVILRIIDRYGDMRNMSYNDESAALTNLVKDMQLPENAPHLDRNGITAWVNELKGQNEQCQALLNQRNAIEAQKASGNVRMVRRMVDPLYKAMVDTINALMVLGTASPAAIAFAGHLNEQIDRYRLSLNMRAGRSNGDEADEG